MTITFKVRQHYGEVTAYPADTTDITAGMLLTVNSSGLIEPAGTASTNIIDIDEGKNLISPLFGEFLGDEKLKIVSGEGTSLRTVQVYFNKNVKAGDIGTPGGAEAVDEHFSHGRSSARC